jgi:PRTRC genetic system protein C
MLVANSLERVFYFDDNGQDIKLSDPDNRLSPEAVLNFYSNTYPILTTAKIDGPEIRDDEVQYRFASTIGTKG